MALPNGSHVFLPQSPSQEQSISSEGAMGANQLHTSQPPFILDSQNEVTALDTARTGVAHHSERANTAGTQEMTNGNRNTPITCPHVAHTASVRCSSSTCPLRHSMTHGDCPLIGTVRRDNPAATNNNIINGYALGIPATELSTPSGSQLDYNPQERQSFPANPAMQELVSVNELSGQVPPDDCSNPIYRILHSQSPRGRQLPSPISSNSSPNSVVQPSAQRASHHSQRELTGPSISGVRVTDEMIEDEIHRLAARGQTLRAPFPSDAPRVPPFATLREQLPAGISWDEVLQLGRPYLPPIEETRSFKKVKDQHGREVEVVNWGKYHVGPESEPFGRKKSPPHGYFQTVLNDD